MKHSSIVKGLGFCILVIVFNLSHLIRKRGEKVYFSVHYNADVYAFSIKMICDMSWYKLQSPYLHPTPSEHKNTEGERRARIRTIKFKEKLKQ